MECMKHENKVVSSIRHDGMEIISRGITKKNLTKSNKTLNLKVAKYT
jgi:hypothetical protein